MPAAQGFQRITDFHGFDPWRARRIVTGLGGFLSGSRRAVNFAKDAARRTQPHQHTSGTLPDGHMRHQIAVFAHAAAAHLL
jgi:hypothetical protein